LPPGLQLIWTHLS